MNDVADAYNKLAEGWDKAYTDNRALAENAVVFDLVRRRLRGFTAPHNRVFEVACGTGLLLDGVSIDSRAYLGWDISPGMVEQARLNHPEHVFGVADVEAELPYRWFDFVVCVFAGVSYLQNPSAWLQKVYQHLNPGGRVLLMPLAQRADDTEQYHYTNDAGERLPRRVWREAEVVNWMMAAGFVDISVRGLTGWSEKLTERVPLWLAKLLQRVDSWTSSPDECLFLIVEGKRP